MNLTLIVAHLAFAATPALSGAADRPALPAGVDRDLFCHMLVSQVAETQERLSDEENAKHARLIDSVHEATSFYIGSITARLTDAQMSGFAKRAGQALATITSDDRATALQYCLDDAMRRASHYADRVEAN